MRQADPPPPTSLEGQFLIAMPSLREGPFARSVVYMCAHRDDGAMGIVINHRAEEIDFGQLLRAARHRAGDRGDPPAAARPGRARVAGRPGRDGTRLRSPFERLRRQRFDGQDRRCLPDRHARHPARDRSRAQARRRPCLRLVTPAGPRASSRARSSPMAGSPVPPTPASSSISISPANTIGRSRSSASTKGCCPPTPATHRPIRRTPVFRSVTNITRAAPPSPPKPRTSPLAP